jgi:hypothetical protein
LRYSLLAVEAVVETDTLFQVALLVVAVVVA